MVNERSPGSGLRRGWRQTSEFPAIFSEIPCDLHPEGPQTNRFFLRSKMLGVANISRVQSNPSEGVRERPWSHT